MTDVKTNLHLCIVFALTLSACGSAPPRVPEPLSEALRARNAASSAFEAGQYRDSLGNFQDAERRFIAIDDDENAALVAISQAEILLLYGEVQHASEVTERATRYLENYREHHDRVHWLRARIGHEMDDPSVEEQLERLLDASPAIAQQARLLRCQRTLDKKCLQTLSSDDPLTRARIERLHAEVLAAQGHYTQAETHLENAQNIYRAHYYRPGIAAVYETRAAHQAVNGDNTSATASLRRALYLRLWIHDGVHATSVLQRLADLSTAQEDRDRYLRWRDWLSGAAEPAWETLMQEIFTPR